MNDLLITDDYLLKLSEGLGEAILRALEPKRCGGVEEWDKRESIKDEWTAEEILKKLDRSGGFCQDISQHMVIFWVELRRLLKDGSVVLLDGKYKAMKQPQEDEKRKREIEELMRQKREEIGKPKGYPRKKPIDYKNF